MARLPAAEILSRLEPDLEAAGLASAVRSDPDRAERAIDLLKSRARKLSDLVPQLRTFLSDTIDRDPAAVAKHLAAAELAPHLAAWRDRLAAVTPFDPPTLEAELRALADKRGIKAGTLIHATRVLVTGQAVSPGIFDVLAVVGRDRVLRRFAQDG
jgi:glutamyl-tRNA synthetase